MKLGKRHFHYCIYNKSKFKKQYYCLMHRSLLFWLPFLCSQRPEGGEDNVTDTSCFLPLPCTELARAWTAATMAGLAGQDRRLADRESYPCYFWCLSMSWSTRVIIHYFQAHWDDISQSALRHSVMETPKRVSEELERTVRIKMTSTLSS